MPDLTTISSILGSIKTATDIARLLKESDISLEKAETKLKLAELVSALADAKIEISEIQELLTEKDKSIRDLQNELNIKAKLHWEKPYYWIIDGESKDGPYCQHCYDKERILVRLQGDVRGCWDCKVCKNVYTDKNYVQPEPSRVNWDAFT